MINIMVFLGSGNAGSSFMSLFSLYSLSLNLSDSQQTMNSSACLLPSILFKPVFISLFCRHVDVSVVLSVWQALLYLFLCLWPVRQSRSSWPWKSDVWLLFCPCLSLSLVWAEKTYISGILNSDWTIAASCSQIFVCLDIKLYLWKLNCFCMKP